MAYCNTDPTLPPPNFAMSDEKMAIRLGILDMEAWRLHRKLEKPGVDPADIGWEAPNERRECGGVSICLGAGAGCGRSVSAVVISQTMVG